MRKQKQPNQKNLCRQSKPKQVFLSKLKKNTVCDTPEAISYSPKTNSFLESEIIDSKQN